MGKIANRKTGLAEQWVLEASEHDALHNVPTYLARSGREMMLLLLAGWLVGWWESPTLWGKIIGGSAICVRS